MKFYLETEFSKSPSGASPKDWVSTKLGSVLQLRNGQRPNIATTGSYPVFGANGIMGYSNQFLVDNDFTLIFGRVGASGEVHLAEGKIWISDNAIYSEKYDRNKTFLPYLSYLLELKNLSQFASKTTHPIITKSFLDSFSINLPPLFEQRAIVEVLGVVDCAIELADRIIAKTERLKRGLMQQLLTRGIGHTETKQTPIGNIPKDWDVVTLGAVCEQRNDMVQPTETGSYTFVGLEHISSGEIKVRNYSKDAFLKSSKFKFYSGDLLYGKLRPYLDKAALVDFDGICSTDLLVLKNKNDVSKEFLAYILHSKEFLDHAIATTSGTNHPRTSWKAISKFKFALPPIPEQQRIADTLLTVDKKLTVEGQERAKLERIKRGLMDLLLTGKVRIKVD